MTNHETDRDFVADIIACVERMRSAKEEPNTLILHPTLFRWNPYKRGGNSHQRRLRNRYSIRRARFWQHFGLSIRLQ